MSQPLSVALTDSRTFLNDQGATLWTDGLLIPFHQVAHRELQTNLFLNASAVVKKESAQFLQPANTPSQTPWALQPADLVEPIHFKEKPVGSADWNFVDMTQSSFIPDLQPTDIIGYWAWDGEQVFFLQCTTDRTIEMYYIKGLPVPAVGTDPVGFIFGETYLGPRAAALAAASVGNAMVHDRCSALADANLDRVIRANIRTGQSVPARKRPYNWRFKLPRRYII